MSMPDLLHCLAFEDFRKEKKIEKTSIRWVNITGNTLRGYLLWSLRVREVFTRQVQCGSCSANWSESYNLK